MWPDSVTAMMEIPMAKYYGVLTMCQAYVLTPSPEDFNESSQNSRGRKHFADEETVSQKLNDMPTITKLENIKVQISV